MPKKTTYSRSSAQRNRTKQKAFELVRPASEEKVLESGAQSEQTGASRKTALKVEEREEIDLVVEEENETQDEEEDEVEEKVEKKPASLAKATPTKKIETVKKAAPVSQASASKAAQSAETADAAPKSVAARIAARREAAQKAAQHSHQHAISAENYAYVRKDLVFILILAIIMFSVIIALHFIIGN